MYRTGTYMTLLNGNRTGQNPYMIIIIMMIMLMVRYVYSLFVVCEFSVDDYKHSFKWVFVSEWYKISDWYILKYM